MVSHWLLSIAGATLVWFCIDFLQELAEAARDKYITHRLRRERVKFCFHTNLLALQISIYYSMEI
jgi:hypothetical protein